MIFYQKLKKFRTQDRKCSGSVLNFLSVHSGSALIPTPIKTSQSVINLKRILCPWINKYDKPQLNMEDTRAVLTYNIDCLIVLKELIMSQSSRCGWVLTLFHKKILNTRPHCVRKHSSPALSGRTDVIYSTRTNTLSDIQTRSHTATDAH